MEEISRKIVSYIEENLDKDLTLEKIAEALNYSKFYMVRVFKDNTGITPYQYIRGRRLDKAAEKLVGTKQPVVEIALEAGYGSQQSFTRVFRCEYGCTPQEYRREYLSRNRAGSLWVFEEARQEDCGDGGRGGWRHELYPLCDSADRAGGKEL